MRAPVQFSAWRALALALALSSAVATARGELDKPQVFPSPNGRWQVVVHHVPDHFGFDFELQDRRHGQVYFRQEKISPDETLPKSVWVYWSPNSRRAALDLPYGRAVAGVSIIDLTGKLPMMEPLRLDGSVSDEANIVTVKCWRNRTDLAVEAYVPGFLALSEAGTTYSLVVRCSGHTNRIIKRRMFRARSGADT